ncbi:hypothetical protein YM18_2518 [Geobacter sulfurreducens]|nr:hypothetical protein YM18_2518 [Geobacter sulfurreducens]
MSLQKLLLIRFSNSRNNAVEDCLERRLTKVVSFFFSTWKKELTKAVKACRVKNT